MYGTVKDDRRLPFLQAASCSQVLSLLLRHWALIPFKDVRDGERRLPFLQAASCSQVLSLLLRQWALIPFKDVRDGQPTQQSANYDNEVTNFSNNNITSMCALFSLTAEIWTSSDEESLIVELLV